MRSAGNRAVLKGRLQVLHVHVFFVAPLRSGNMAKSGTHQHQRRVAVREGSNHPCAAANLSVQSLDHVVGTNPGPVLKLEFAASAGFSYTVLNLLSGLFQLHCTKFFNDSFPFLWMLSCFPEHGLLSTS